MNKERNRNVGLRQIPLKMEYNTDEDDIINDLYAPCLQNSVKYDRAVGYFRANIYRELGVHLITFAKNGGKVRIVCSPDISESDEKYAREGYFLRGKRSSQEKKITLLKIFELMSKNPIELDCLEMLRFLIENASLELYIAMRPGGIYHRKIGMFTDEAENIVVFSGSGNETLPATGTIENWSNDEDFDVFRGWGDDFESKKARTKEDHLVRLFNGTSGRTRVRRINEVEKEYLNKFRKYKTYEDCIEGIISRATKMKIKKTKSISPYKYQLDAIDSWISSGYNGMISMPTGTGKTYTSLLAIEDLMNKGHPILIVVPTTVLIEQWHNVIKSLFGNIPILLAGGGHNWRKTLNKRIFVSDIRKPRIIIATMSTAASTDFIEYLEQTDKVILIADEAHRLGAPSYQKILDLKYFGKMGLSATPIRLFDHDGNQKIIEAFGEKPVYHLELDSFVQISEYDDRLIPILGNFLCRYEYFYYKIDLTMEEKQRWNEITERIRKLAAISKIASNEKQNSDNIERLKLLLVQRSKIAKKAENKLSIVEKILRERYRSTDKWIVYCEDEAQLVEVYNILRAAFASNVILKYYSKMGLNERERNLALFSSSPSIIISIRCLDEGVDIPNANGALILASSTNPRQYIQRRGRVLRKSLFNKIATIIDVLVLPECDEDNLPFSIVKTELARALAFSKTAINHNISHELWQLCIQYGVDISSDGEKGLMEHESVGGLNE